MQYTTIVWSLFMPLLGTSHTSDRSRTQEAGRALAELPVGVEDRPIYYYRVFLRNHLIKNRSSSNSVYSIRINVRRIQCCLVTVGWSTLITEHQIAVVSYASFL